MSNFNQRFDILGLSMESTENIKTRCLFVTQRNLPLEANSKQFKSEDRLCAISHTAHHWASIDIPVSHYLKKINSK